MRIIPFIISAAIAIALIVVLNTKIGGIPPLGKMLSPSHGLWQNAEPDDFSYNLNFESADLLDEVNVYFDERLVPHVFAQNDHDLYFVQGYLHARFRLWQMEFQTHAAAGRLSEILGEKVGENSVLERHDRQFRRMGMVYAAENALKAIEKNDTTRNAIDAYTKGVNYYISQLQPQQYPIEYKLLDYAPEPWTPLKTALFLKYMSYDLAYDIDDFAHTNLRNKLGDSLYRKVFPYYPDSLSPVVPTGTAFAPASLSIIPPRNVDSLYSADAPVAVNAPAAPDPDNGSNNWVVGGSRTESGRPILCNDPHLGLNLPSLWYEMQLHTPQHNSYGVSFPGSPAIIIGFTDSIAWGVTNSSRDVMDFYEVKFRDSTMNEYLFDGEWKKTSWRTENISLRGKADYTDKIAMTVWGPVMFDVKNALPRSDGQKAYAIRWKAHDESNELRTFLMLNRATNYSGYYNAISTYTCPGQNFLFASKRNTIAVWQQGSFPARWKGQGDFVMPGWDSSFMWQGFIPMNENAYSVNPERGFASSANQRAADSTYPYYLAGEHDVYRGFIINRFLSGMTNVGVNDMKQLQTNNYNVFAETALPLMLRNIDTPALSNKATQMLTKLNGWNYDAGPNAEGQTVFFEWWNAFRKMVWYDELVGKDTMMTLPWPQDNTLIDALHRDSAFAFIDDKATVELETLPQLMTKALNETADKLSDGAALDWGTYRPTIIGHLLSGLPGFSRSGLKVGGGNKIINATKEKHGPSWRMIVHLTDETEAYGIYPGGQSGNPGSKYYDDFVDSWAAGTYNKLWVMSAGEERSSKVMWTMNFKKGKA